MFETEGNGDTVVADALSEDSIDTAPMTVLPVGTTARQIDDEPTELETRVSAAAVQVVRLSEALKQAKASLKSLSEQLSDLQEEDCDPAAEIVADSDADDWRQISTLDLFVHPIKGIGDKKIQAIVELCPTLGDLETLRTKVGSEADSFHKLLPKGIGVDAAQDIEDRLLDVSWKAQDDGGASHESQVLARMQELTVDYDSSIDASHEAYQAGRYAADEGESVTICTWTETSENQDPWIRGWLSVDLNTEEEVSPASSLNGLL